MVCRPVQRFSTLPCSFFSVSQNFCSSVKYLSRMKTFERPRVPMLYSWGCALHRLIHSQAMALITSLPFSLSRTISHITGCITSLAVSLRSLPSVRFVVAVHWQERTREDAVTVGRDLFTCLLPRSTLRASLALAGWLWLAAGWLLARGSADWLAAGWRAGDGRAA